MTKNDQKWSNYVGFGKNRSFFVIFRDFQMYVTMRKIDRFFRLSYQIKALFFFFNLFVKHLLSPLIACYWSIISDYFSSIFLMLNSNKKNGICSKTVSQSRFWVYTSVLVYAWGYISVDFLICVDLAPSAIGFRNYLNNRLVSVARLRDSYTREPRVLRILGF